MHARLVAVLGLEDFSKIIILLNRSCVNALAADCSAHIGGTSYFCFRVRITPLSMYDDVYDLHVVATPMCGLAYEGICLMSRPRCWALDPGWRTNVIGVTSDGALNMVGSVSGWQTRIRNGVED